MAAPRVPKVAFLCIHNACRSQIAEAWARKLFGPRVLAVSAGTHPAVTVNVMAVNIMREFGVNMADHFPKRIEDLKSYEPFDVVISVCGEEGCPTPPQTAQHIHRPFYDPSQGIAAGLPHDRVAESFRVSCGEIRDYVATTLPALFPELNKTK